MIKPVIAECVASGIPLGPNGGVVEHDCVVDSQSGAGNCVCGRPCEHRLHTGRHI